MTGLTPGIHALRHFLTRIPTHQNQFWSQHGHSYTHIKSSGEKNQRPGGEYPLAKMSKAMDGRSQGAMDGALPVFGRGYSLPGRSNQKMRPQKAAWQEALGLNQHGIDLLEPPRQLVPPPPALPAVVLQVSKLQPVVTLARIYHQRVFFGEHLYRHHKLVT